MFSIERSIFNKDIVLTMKDAKDVISDSLNQVKVDEVANIVDDLAEQMNDVNEIGTLLSQPVISNTLDDDDLLKDLEQETGIEELEALEKIKLPVESVPTVSSMRNLPSVPNVLNVPNVSSVKNKDSDSELLDLVKELEIL
jgi:hypothetical protein